MRTPNERRRAMIDDIKRTSSAPEIFDSIVKRLRADTRMKKIKKIYEKE